MNNTKISIKEARANFAELVDRASLKGEIFTVTKFGRPRVLVVPIEEFVPDSSYNQKKVVGELFGAWSDRKDIKDAIEYAKKLRKETSTRKHGKIFD